MAKTTLELFDEKEAYFKALWSRYDADKKLIYMDDYELKNAAGESLPKDAGAISLTLNLAANQARVVSRKLIKAEKQLVIEGTKNNRAMNDKETGKIEAFVNNAFDMADDRLKKRFIPSLKAMASNHLVVRGDRARRSWSYVTKDGVYIPDILPLDIRYVRYEIGPDGINWGGYEGKRNSQALYLEYNVKENKLRGSLATFEDKDEEVTIKVIYTDKVEEVWAEKTLISQKEHKFGYPPIVIQVVGSGFMLMDEGYLEHWGESVLEMNRKLYDEANRQASIEQSLMMKSLLPPVVQTKETNTDATIDYPSKSGSIQPIPKGNKVDIVPTPDLNMASRMAVSRLNAVMQQAGFNDVDLGNTDLSAVSIATQSAIRDQQLSPFLEALAGIDEQTAEMLIGQYRAGGYKAEVGRQGSKASISPADLDGDYTIRYIYMSKDVKQEIANLAMAQAAKAMGLPDEHIIRDIYKYDNPGELLAQMQSQKAERDDPVIGIVRRAHALVDEAQDLDADEKNAKLIESMLLTDTAVNILKQRYNPQPVPENMQPGNNQGGQKITGSSLVPLLGAGKMAGQPQEANVG
jgi:hypothetical protein